MKTILTLFAFLLFINTVNAQCDEYYINELISGVDDNCYFPSGSPVRFCPGLRGIAINGKTFNVMQWDGISTQYLTLTLNGGIAGTLVLKLKERELLLNLNGCGGARTYSISLNQQEYNEFEIKRKVEQEERVRLNNLEIKSKIDIEIESNNLINAVNLYNNWSTPEIEYKSKIQSAINNDTTTTKSLSENQLSYIISKFSSYFMKQKLGTYNLYGRKDGTVQIKTSIDTFIQTIGKDKSLNSVGGFILPYSFESELIISETKSKVDKDSIRYVFSDKFKRKDIYISQKGNYYIGKFGAPLSAERLNAPQFISDQVLKGNIELEALTKTEKKANNMVLGDKKSWELEKTIPVKKGTGRKVFRIVTSPIWGLFYVLLLFS
jgi:hypothetical protein